MKYDLDGKIKELFKSNFYVGNDVVVFFEFLIYFKKGLDIDLVLESFFDVFYDIYYGFKIVEDYDIIVNFFCLVNIFVLFIVFLLFEIFFCVRVVVFILLLVM